MGLQEQCPSAGRSRRDTLILVMLLAVCAPLGGCGARDSEPAWVDAYRRHARFVQAAAMDQREMLHVDDSASCIIPGVVLWPYRTGPWIARVNRAVVRADLRAGDRIVAVNGRYVSNLSVLLLRLSRLQHGDVVELTIDRRHELRRVAVRCGDSRAVFEATVKVLEAAAAGAWQECLDFATVLPSIARVHYSWAAQLQHDCSEALRLSARRAPGPEDAALAHQWARLRLEEAKDIPDAIDRVRWRVSDTIYWLERHGFEHLAKDLDDHLDAYSPHLW